MTRCQHLISGCCIYHAEHEGQEYCEFRDDRKPLGSLLQCPRTETIKNFVIENKKWKKTTT